MTVMSSALMILLFCTTTTFAAFFVARLIGHALSSESARWLPTSMVLLILSDCLVAKLANLVGLRAPGVSLLVLLHLLVSVTASIAASRISRGAEPCTDMRAARSLRVCSVVSHVALLAVAAVCCLAQFGPELNVHFASTDPAAHFRAALAIRDTGVVSGLFSTRYLASLFIELLSPLTGPMQTYKAFIASEVFLLYLGAVAFHELQLHLLEHEDGETVGGLLPLVLSTLYVLGYPLNNLVFGFSYLGFGVTLLIVFSQLQSALLKRRGPGPAYALVSVAALAGEAIAYSLFTPIVLFSTALQLVGRRLDILRRHLVRTFAALSLFLVVTVVTITAAARSGAVEVLATPGYIYTNLFGSFVLVAPASIACLFRFASKGQQARKEDPVLWFCVAALVTTAGAFVLYWTGVFSAYYYYKFYYVLWACAFLCASRELSRTRTKDRPAYVTYAVLCLAVLTLAFSGVDRRIMASHPDLNPSPTSDSLVGAYAFNRDFMFTPRISDEKVGLWKRAGELRESGGGFIPMLSNNIDVYWYQAQTQQMWEEDSRYFYFWEYPDNACGEMLLDRLSEVDFCVLIDGTDLPDEVEDYLDEGDIVYENGAGRIVELP